MRHVAIILVVLLTAAALPATAQTNVHDECRGLQAQKPCHMLEVPSASRSGAVDTYYVYLASLQCAPGLSRECTGAAAGAEGPVDMVGLVYKEDNGLPGLQRFKTFVGNLKYEPDTMVLL